MSRRTRETVHFIPATSRSLAATACPSGATAHFRDAAGRCNGAELRSPLVMARTCGKQLVAEIRRAVGWIVGPSPSYHRPSYRYPSRRTAAKSHRRLVTELRNLAKGRPPLSQRPGLPSTERRSKEQTDAVPCRFAMRLWASARRIQKGELRRDEAVRACLEPSLHHAFHRTAATWLLDLVAQGGSLVTPLPGLEGSA